MDIRRGIASKKRDKTHFPGKKTFRNVRASVR
jgi:hypothetical protein